MKNVVCWKTSEVRRIINPFAEHMPDSLFRAVHTDWTLKMSPPVGTSFQELVASPASYADVEPTTFLGDFLRSDRPHVLAVALGDTGSGKSHLIHWMRLNIKEDESRMVLVVRKSGTSLRAIVEMIIDRLPPGEQQGFRDVLNRAGDGTATRDGQKQQLLNDIAYVIREDSVSEGDETAEIEDALIKYLPDLFQDPYIRETRLLKDDYIVSNIVDHIFAPSSAGNRPTERYAFELGDLPLGGMDFVNASKNARNALQVIDGDPVLNRPMSLRIINRNLAKATSRTLSFSGDRVEELMGRLRTHLKKQGRELVLLVEEFARLQGIDRALLQAITNQGDGGYCRMRSAIAVTTGFFGSVAETAYMRTTHIIDMDRSAGRQKEATSAPHALATFAARYLNAVRLGVESIEDWSEAAEPGEHPPSACATCTYRDECHPVFGHIDGYGLYPFTQTALQNASIHVHKSKPDAMNPRILQNEVLAEVLDVNETSILTGQFPSMQFVDRLGMDSIKTNDRGRLKNVGSDFADRLIPFLEFYDGSGRIFDLPAGLRGAFGIPPIPEDVVESDDSIAEPQPDEPSSPKVDVEADAINEWARGGILDQRVAQGLREAIFNAVSEAVDWDMLGLERSTFLGQTRLFQKISVNFERASTEAAAVRSGAVRLKLMIPGEVDPDKAGLALIGLLKAGRQQHFRWSFEQGADMLAAFLDCLAIWTRDVEKQLRQLTGPRENWDAPRAALELLSIGAAFGGRTKVDSSTSDILDAALGQWPDCASEAPELRTLHERLWSKRGKLLDIVRAQISLMKGGQAGPMIEPRTAAAAIRTLRTQKWKLTMEPPADERGDYAVLAKLYSETKSSLEAAVLAERAVRLSWLREMDEAFGASQPRSKILESVRNLKEIASANGLAGGGNANAFAAAIETFGSVQFEDAIAAARALIDVEGTECIPLLGRGRRAAVIAGRDLKKATETFLQSVETNLQSFVGRFRAENDRIEDSIRLAEDSLIAIDASLANLKEPDKEPSRAA
ncbi:hypothetical protein ABIE71_000283 [Bradyrhizobium diazoefficiens]